MISTRIVTSKDEWESFLKTKPEANFLQSWYWGQFHKALGKEVEPLGFYQNQKLVGVCLSIVEPARRGKYLTVAGGPIIDFTHEELFGAFVDEITKTAKRHHCVFVRVRPQIVEDGLAVNLFDTHGFRLAPMHLTADLTSQLDLSPDEETLLKNMRKTTRYEIKKAERERIIMKASDDPNDIAEFYNLQLATAQRHGFVPFSEKFLYEQFKTFVENGAARLYKAYKGQTLLSAAFIIYYGQEATYHYGASTQEARKYPGAYLIQWEVIKEAKRRGFKRYNFWGVETLDNIKHRFYGVSVFKRGFGGYDVQYLHAQDLVIGPIAYLVNLIIESARRKLRRL